MMVLLAFGNFWIALAIYLFVGALHKSFNESLSKVFAGVITAVIVSALAAWSKSDLSAQHTLIWSGNLALAGAYFGWMFADSLHPAE
jgi:hypothetical protein